MSTIHRGPLGTAFLLGRDNGNSAGGATATAPTPSATPGAATNAAPAPAPAALVTAPATLPPPQALDDHDDEPIVSEHPATPGLSAELIRSIAEVKGQAQFLLYLADQIEDSLHQLADGHDESQTAFLCRILGMYSSQLEAKHQGLGDKIAETCQEVYVTVREFDAV